MENKQTAVEWLIDQVEDFIGLIPIDIIAQAKAMEKQQIMDAYDDGKSDGYKTAREWDEIVIFSNAEQYYTETYKSNT